MILPLMKKRPKDNIDKIFKNKFSDFESDPFPDTKEKVFTEYYSQEAEKKRLGSTIFKNLLVKCIEHKYAVAAVLAGLTLFSLGIYLNTDHSENNTISVVGNSKINKSDADHLPFAATHPEMDTEVKDTEPIRIMENKKVESIPVTSKKQILICYKSEKERIIKYLPDSSRVYLNKNSELTFSPDFIGNDRAVAMSGEVYFDVKKNKNLPFIISTPLGKVEVLGTSFSVRTFEDGREEIIVESGKVLFYEKQNPEKNKIILTPGMKAVLTAGKPIMTVTDNHHNDLSWKTNKLVFNKTSLREVIKDIETVFDIKINPSDSKIYDCHFTARFDLPVPLDEVIATLALSLNGSYEIKDKVCILKSNGCN
jgi:hypothetical protein